MTDHPVATLDECALNPAYQLLDITALGRQEEELAHPMAWVKLHDEYAR